MKWIFPYSFLVLLFFSCGESNYMAGPKPKALGVANQITVISEESIWEGETGDSLRFYLESVYPVLPRPEPLFDLRYFTPFEIAAEKLRRELRTYLICVNVQDTASRAFKMAQIHLGKEALSSEKVSLKLAKDKWATGQIILYLIAPNDSMLASSVGTYFPSIREQVNKHDRKQIRSKTYLSGESPSVIKSVQALFGISMKVPGDFQIALEEENMMWLRKDFEDITVNILLTKLAYIDQSQFSKESMQVVRNELGRKYVSSSSDSSYMVINDEDLPMYVFQRTVNNNFAMEARGIWEMENDFMGGPFLSYLIQMPSKNELLFVDGFVLAPGQKKRNIMQEIELIIHSIE